MGSVGQKAVLVYGYGNPGRQDDGLGPCAAERISERLSERISERITALDLEHVRADASYQLQIEDAAEVLGYDLVLFVDAAVEGAEPFSVRKLAPEMGAAFSSHALKPEHVLAICGEQFGKVPEAYLIGIRGYEFDFREGLTEKAQKNLDEALAYIVQLLTAYKGKTMAQNKSDQKTILIIDDDADLRAAMRIVLESSGFVVGEAADGEEGLKTAERIKPDAIILDLMMETIDAGSKVSTRLKEKGYKGPIFLLSSAGDTVRYNIDARELGLAGIFQKPIDHKLLINTLKKQLKVG